MKAEMDELSSKHLQTIKQASKYLSGHKKRIFQAQVTQDYLNGSARKAERVFGWCRKAVETGLNEHRSGFECICNYSARGNRKTEDKLPHLEEDIKSLAEVQSQVDPKFQSPFVFTRMTAKVTPNKYSTHYSCVIRTLYFGRNGCLLSFCSIFLKSFFLIVIPFS